MAPGSLAPLALLGPVCSGVVPAPAMVAGGGETLPRRDPQEDGWPMHPSSFHVAREKFPLVKGLGGCVGRYQEFDHDRARSDPE